MLLFWPLAVTAGIGAYKQKKLPEEIFRCIENYLISSTRPGQAPQQTSSVNTAQQHERIRLCTESAGSA